MKVILLKTIPKVGKKDEVVEVPEGYARNALFPKKFAIPGTPEALHKHTQGLAATDAHQKVQHELGRKIFAALHDVVVTIPAKHNEHGVLFKRLSLGEVVAAITTQTNTPISVEDVVLGASEIKQTGEYHIHPKEFPEYRITIRVV